MAGTSKKSGGRAAGSPSKRPAVRGAAASKSSKTRAAGGGASKAGAQKAGGAGKGGARAAAATQATRMSTRDIALDYAVGGLDTKADRAAEVDKNLGQTESLRDFLKSSGW